MVDLGRQAEATAQHLALGAVAVVGAGLSIDSRFPMTGGLNSLLWDALDSDLDARAAVAAFLGQQDGSSKGLVGDSWENALVAWKAVAGSALARARFQGQFSVLDAERAVHPSPAHEALARLVHAGVVECVVSLNWDTALERAYRRIYGVSVPEGVLFKPHGDAAYPDAVWTLPHEPGSVPEYVSNVVQRLADGHARTLMIVGYSERDQVIVDQLLRPLDESWRTVRIGPSATGTQDMAAVAEVALPLLAEPYARREDESSWHVVTYRGGRDIRAALRGERLDPRDVDACPQLPEADLLVDALRAEHAVVLNGPAGSGKSITVYQALRRLADDGFETLRLRDDARGNGMRKWLEDLRTFPRPKALLLDDAQDMSADIVRELAEHADNKTLVVVAGIDHIAGGVRTLRLAAGAAVTRLGRWVRNERESVFPLIRELDASVGSHAKDLYFDRRIEVAEREETPWRFFYTLTGGWRRIRQTALQLRDVQRADLLLLAIAVAQVAGVDAGVERSELFDLARQLGRTDVWLTNSLHELKTRNLILESDNRLRCVHLQSAYSVISWMLHPVPWNSPHTPRPVVPPVESAGSGAASSAPSLIAAEKPTPMDLSAADAESDREAVCLLMNAVLDNPATPLRGLAWLAGRGIYGDERSILRWKGVLGPARDKHLALRAVATPPDGDVAAAAQLLSDTIAYSQDGDVIATVKAHDDDIRAWYEAISPQNAWALGDLANSLHQPDKVYAARVAGYANPEQLSTLVLDGGWPHSSSTGHALDRLCNVGGPSVREAIAPHIDSDAYLCMLDTGNPEFWRTVGLLEDLLSVDATLALRLFMHASLRLALQFNAAPLPHWNDMSHFIIRLGYGPSFLRGGRKRPGREVRTAVRAFIRSLDKQATAATLACPNEQWGEVNFYNFVNLLSEVDPSTFQAIARLVDLEQFESCLLARSEKPGRTAFYVLLQLQAIRPEEIHALLDRVEPTLKHLDVLIPYMAPDIATRALRRGLPLDLELDHHHWEMAGQVLELIHADDPIIAGELARSNRQTMSLGLAASAWHDAWEGLGHWTRACDQAAPGLIEEVIADLPEGAVTSWARALKRPGRYSKSRKADIGPLIHRAAGLAGHVKEEADALILRFPSLSQYQSRT